MLYCIPMSLDHEILIVGGGVAGLACLQELSASGHGVHLISKDIGGRLCTSKNGKVNYGAYVLPTTDTMIESLIERTERVHLSHIVFHAKGKGYSIISVLRYWKELVGFLPFLFFYRRRYRDFRAYATKHGTLKAFKAFPKIYALHQTSALDFIQSKGIQQLTDRFLEEPVWMCTFAKLKDLNAFDFMHIAMYLNANIHKFQSRVDQRQESLQSHISIEEVTQIKETPTRVTVTLADGQKRTCRHLVLATPYEVTRTLINVKHDRTPCTSYLFHVRGTLKPRYADADLELFQETNSTIFLSVEADGTIIFYSTKAHPDFDIYFERHDIIASRHWDPAFYLGGSTLIDPEYSPRITLAGDFNIVGMEDTYRTGVFAATRATR